MVRGFLDQKQTTVFAARADSEAPNLHGPRNEYLSCHRPIQ